MIHFCRFSIYKLYSLIHTHNNKSWKEKLKKKMRENVFVVVFSLFSQSLCSRALRSYFVLVPGRAAPALPLLSGPLTTLSGLWRDELAFWVTSCSILFLMATSRPWKEEKRMVLRLFKSLWRKKNLKDDLLEILIAHLFQLLLLNNLCLLWRNNSAFDKEKTNKTSLNLSQDASVCVCSAVHIWWISI